MNTKLRLLLPFVGASTILIFGVGLLEPVYHVIPVGRLLEVRGADPSFWDKGPLNCTEVNCDFWNRGLPIGDPFWVYTHDGCESFANGADCIACEPFQESVKLKNTPVKGAYIESYTVNCNYEEPNTSYAGKCQGGICTLPWTPYYCGVEMQIYQQQSLPPDT